MRIQDMCESLHQGLNTAGEKVKFVKDGFPIIQTRNINNGNINITDKLKFLSKKDWQKYNEKYKPKIGDVFFTNIGTIGKTAIVKNEMNYLIHWNIFKLRPNLSLCTSEYLKIILDHLTLKQYFQKLQKGGTVNFVTKKMISDVDIMLPPLAEQQRIVAKLDAAFTEIDKTISMVLKSIENLDLLFEKKIKQHFVDNIINAPFVKLSDISEYFNGLTYSPKDVSENGTIVLRSGNIQNGKMKYSDIKRVNKKIKDKLYVKSTDILICSRNGSQKLIGKSSLIGEINEPMTFGTFMMIIRSEYNEYLQWFVKSKLFKKQIVKGENTMINQITRYMLDDISLPFPDAKSYKKISKELKELDGHRRRLNEIFNTKIENFKKLKSAYLKKALQKEAA